MESFKQQVQEVQVCQSALRVPEEAVTSLPICRNALNLQQEASQLQHTAIQQCNILQVKHTHWLALGTPGGAHIVWWIISQLFTH